jgi:glycosyltransferase involved in cell wall biosynthesis
MRLLFLSKRHPQGRDLFHEPFGRFYHLPRSLAEQDHDVHLFLLGYNRERPTQRHAGRLEMRTCPALLTGPSGYARAAAELLRERHHDWAIGCSDIWFGILAQHLAARHGARSLIDAYDNCETYHPMVPPLRHLWRRALRLADAVTAAGPPLAEFMAHSAGRDRVHVVPMAADPCFASLDRTDCRRVLGLPTAGQSVGFMGTIDRRRGMDLLFDAWSRLKAQYPALRLVVSGRLERGMHLTVGTLEPRKNLERVVRCFFALIQQQGIRDLDLVLVGAKGCDFEGIFRPSRRPRSCRGAC